jgi:hypothetical protein
LSVQNEEQSPELDVGEVRVGGAKKAVMMASASQKEFFGWLLEGVLVWVAR